MAIRRFAQPKIEQLIMFFLQIWCDSIKRSAVLDHEKRWRFIPQFDFGSVAAIRASVRSMTASGRLAELIQGRGLGALTTPFGQKRNYPRMNQGGSSGDELSDGVRQSGGPSKVNALPYFRDNGVTTLS
jgi:hypothetical protein